MLSLDVMYAQMGMIFSVICVVLTFYNSSLRMEVGYVAYFVLALPFVRRYSDSFNEQNSIDETNSINIKIRRIGRRKRINEQENQ